jgi:hypothetical protein
MPKNIETNSAGLASKSVVRPTSNTPVNRGAPTTEENHCPSKGLKDLTVDIGTASGWSLKVGQEIRDSGTEVLASDEELRDQRKEGKERTGDIRFGRLIDFLERKALAHGLDRLVIEDVIFARSPDQAQLWASLRAAIWVVARNLSLDVRCVPVATLKVFATGNGAADKSMMARSLAAAMPERYVQDPETGTLRCLGRALDDNEVDAIWLARYTAAADRGEVTFLSVHERKVARRTETRAKRNAAKAETKARNEALKVEARTKRRELMAAIKSAGKCCGVFRKASPYNRAVCPKCGQAIRIPKATGSSPVSNPNPDFAPIPAAQVETRRQYS